MTEQKLREIFKNKSNCYADSDDVVQAIDEDRFVTLVTEILELSHNNKNTPCDSCTDDNCDKCANCCPHCGKQLY